MRGEGAGSSEAGTPSRDDPPPSGRGFGIAYAFLNRRERTEAELRARLVRGEVAAEEIEMVVAELLEFGYLDDARYARVFTEDKRNLEAWGNERIARALRERGVERELIEAALAQEREPHEQAGQLDVQAGQPDVQAGEVGVRAADMSWHDDRVRAGGELARATALLGQRFPAGPLAPRDRERAFGVLARKGYESETAADAVREWARRTAL